MTSAVQKGDAIVAKHKLALSRPGGDAILEKGWFGAHKWLIARRVSQFGILGLFLLGPWVGVWVVKGNLSSSLTLGVLPLTDPFVLLQTLVAAHLPEISAWIGVVLVGAFYVLVGGRAYCSWVCPVNVVTDTAGWLRRRLNIKTSRTPPGNLRYWLLAGALVASAASGFAVWEFVNPVSILHRALVFGAGMAWLIVAGIFFFDLLVASRGWCGHVCPMGACYSLIGRVSLLRVSARHRSACNDCMDCFAICPEPQVIRPALKGAGGAGPVIQFPECTNCGRCIDVCSKDVFHFTSRFDQRSE